MARALATLGGIVLVGALVALSAAGTIQTLVAVSLAAGCLALVALGPERLGTALFTLAMFTAPENTVRPSASATFVTVSDLLLGLAVLLLFPIMLRGAVRLPAAFVVGSTLLAIGVLLSSLLSPDPVPGLVYGSRLIAAVVALPLIFMLWRPGRRTVDTLAWAYVAGHVVSTGFAVVEGPAVNNRYDGLTTHFNYFGHAAALSICLLIYLFHRTPARHRWVVWGAGAVSLASIAMSGSRASAIVVVMIALVYPLLQRSLLSAYLLIGAALAFVVVGDRLLVLMGSSSLADRLQGDATTSTSDQQRIEALNTALGKFLAHPLLGGSFGNDPKGAHNIYLQVAVGVGVFGLVVYLLIMWTSVRALFLTSRYSRLGYTALAYAGLGFLTNSLWDRFVWMAVSLAFLAHVSGDEADDPPATADDVGARGSAPAATHAGVR
jgi:O-antigen ligase